MSNNLPLYILSCFEDFEKLWQVLKGEMYEAFNNIIMYYE